MANNKTAKDLPKPRTLVGCNIPTQQLSPTSQGTQGCFAPAKPPSLVLLPRVCMGHQRGQLTCPEGIVLHPLCGSQCCSLAWPGCPSSSSASPACHSSAAAPLGTPAHPSLQAHKEQGRHDDGIGNPSPPGSSPKAAPGPALSNPINGLGGIWTISVPHWPQISPPWFANTAPDTPSCLSMN